MPIKKQGNWWVVTVAGVDPWHERKERYKKFASEREARAAESELRDWCRGVGEKWNVINKWFRSPL